MTGTLGAERNPAEAEQILGGNWRNAYGLLGPQLSWIVSFNYNEHITEVRDVNNWNLELYKTKYDPVTAFGFGDLVDVRFQRSSTGYSRPPIPQQPLPPGWMFTQLVPRYL
jgi:hypothetical protein